MPSSILVTLSAWLLILAMCVQSRASDPPGIEAKPRPVDGLVVCGMDEVFVVSLDTLVAGKIEKLWSWRAAERPELPKPIAKRFGTTDECKPIAGNRLLVTSSGGGCALIDRESGHASWFAIVPNAHSIELLPKDRVVVAGSTGAKGNCLVLFDLSRSETSLWDTELYSAHGVVWDDNQQQLWALGSKELRCYRLKDWETSSPSLELDGSYAIPDEGGHDLQPMPHSDELVLSTHEHVYLFDRITKRFRLHPILGKQQDVKCISINPIGGRVVWLQADQPNWWTDRIRLLDPDAEVQLTDEKLYKARWVETVGK
jgi:hypothetical protein